jgi:hypothetical protein
LTAGVQAVPPRAVLRLAEPPSRARSATLMRTSSSTRQALMQRAYPYTIRFIQFETRRREAYDRLLLSEARRAARRKRTSPARTTRS